jgi:hypothetical protein
MKEQHEGLPVKGYRPQNQDAVDAVNENKVLEERLLRHIDEVAYREGITMDGRWCAIAKTHLELAFMALNRAIFKPERASLPEDPRPVWKEPHEQ